MNLTLRQFFNQFPILKQTEFANLCEMHNVNLNRVIAGDTISREQFEILQERVQQLANDLAKVTLVHNNFHEGRGKYQRKQ